MRSFIRWSAWLCLSMVLWTAAVESTHHHASKTESTSCSICVVAHSTAQSASTHHARPIFRAIGLLQERDVIAQARLACFELGSRGPPAV